MNELPKRKKNRLDKSHYIENSTYYVTICSKNKRRIFSRIVKSSDIDSFPYVELTDIGKTVDFSINCIEKYYDSVTVENYVIMPDHIHLMFTVNNADGRMISAPTVVGSMKRYVSRKTGLDLWQKGFYDHIIRDDSDFEIKWNYIAENPLRWILKHNNITHY